MPGDLSLSVSPIVRLLKLEPKAAKEAWAEWRRTTEFSDLDGDHLALLPLLSSRLKDWIAETTADEPLRQRLVGICKLGWVKNQLQYKRLIDTWTLLEVGGVHPITICGPAAWAAVYLQEGAVRPISSLEILVPRAEALLGTRLLVEAGWNVVEDSPSLNGDALDRYEGVWFRSHDDVSLCLRWRLMAVAPELAAELETLPKRDDLSVCGRIASMLSTEELLLTAAASNHDDAVHWECDVTVLLRTRAVDWARFKKLAHGTPIVWERLRLLQHDTGISIPGFVLKKEKTGYLRTRFSRAWRDYRRTTWANGSTRSKIGFLKYAVRRFSLPPASETFSTVLDSTTRNHRATLREYKRYRTLFVFLALRDIQIRYKRTWRGVLWALVQPILPMLIFAFVFAHVVRPELRERPYWLFVLTGFAPWLFFANGVNYASVSFTNNLNLITKVYFPRAILPAAAIAACLLDLAVATVFVLFLACWTGHYPTLHLLFMPVCLGLASFTAAATGLAAASLSVQFRDTKPLIPFLVQVWMYATPVLYPLALIPVRWRHFMWINPMTAVVELFRAGIFSLPIDLQGMAISLISLAALTGLAMTLFARVEADLAERS